MPRNSSTGAYTMPASSVRPAVDGTVINSTDFNAQCADIENEMSYAYGTFTPVFTAATTPPSGVTYSSQIGVYSKIGRVVFFRVQLILTSKGTGGVGAIRITGLPYTTAASMGSCPAALTGTVDLSAGKTFLVAFLPSNQTFITISEGGDNVNPSSVTWSQASDASDFYISGTYFV